MHIECKLDVGSIMYECDDWVSVFWTVTVVGDKSLKNVWSLSSYTLFDYMIISGFCLVPCYLIGISHSGATASASGRLITDALAHISMTFNRCPHATIHSHRLGGDVGSVWCASPHRLAFHSSFFTAPEKENSRQSFRQS